MTTAWTPYAAHAKLAPADIATPVAAAVSSELAKRLAKVDLCLTGKSGSVVAMLEIATDGSLRTSRIGGIGHKPAEDCIATAIRDLRVKAPSRPVEIECGFGGEAGGPLRMTLDAGHDLVEVTRTKLHHGGTAHELTDAGFGGAKPAANRTHLVIVAPDAPAKALEAALEWVAPALALVAVKADGGPPVFVAMADSRTTAGLRRIELDVAGRMLRVCVAGELVEQPASLLEPKRIDGVMKAAIAVCGKGGCADVVWIGSTGDFVAKDLVAAVSAARRAGLDPLLVTPGYACPP